MLLRLFIFCLLCSAVLIPSFSAANEAQIWKRSEAQYWHLKVGVDRARGSVEVLKDSFQIQKLPELRFSELPPLEINYVQSGDTWFPRDTGPVIDDHPLWEYLFGVGRVESVESGDVLLLPISLMERNENCIHNGILRIPLEKGVARKHGQLNIVAETCQYFQWQASWSVPVEVKAGSVMSDGAFLADAWARLNARLPLAGMSELVAEQPGVREQKLANAVKIPGDQMSVYGLVLDGTHYLGGCHARGELTDVCEERFVPSYSTAKSLFAGLALMRLERLYPGSESRPTPIHRPTFDRQESSRH